MSYKIFWTSHAYSDFSQIVRFIKETWGKKSAEEFIDQIDAIVNLLSNFPFIGKIIYLQKHIRSFVISKQTTLIYRIKDEKITILNLFDNRQSPDKLKVNENVGKYFHSTETKIVK
ncbi:MAG: type II toxin-antitoxin system RelE/ParE family toxin [Bacteroidetes bacterium]|nr:type II toxin-antitoxin system RelE/ParE family toxin [Bacteroidota bacterium]